MGWALLAVTLPRQAFADEPRSRVAVFSAPGASEDTSEAALRLAGELRGAGFDVVLHEQAPATEPCRQPAPGPEVPAPFATIFLTDSSDGRTADVWVCDRLTDKALFRQVSSGGDAGALAIRASELLRASLLELAIDPKASLPDDVARWLGPVSFQPPPPAEPAGPTPAEPPTAEPPPPAAPPTPPGPSPRRPAPRSPSEPALEPFPPDDFTNSDGDLGPKGPERAASIGAAFAILMSFYGFPAAIGPEVDLRYRPVGGLEISGRIALPFSTGVLRNPTVGTASLTHGVGLAYVGYRFGADSSPLRPAVAAGAGLYWLSVTGHALVAGQDHHQDSPSIAPSFEADLEMRFHERVRGRLGVSAFFPLPEPVVIIGNQQPGRSGEPMVLGTFGVGITL